MLLAMKTRNVTGALLSVHCHSLRLAVFLSYLCYSIAADGCADNPCRFGSTCLDGGATCNCTQGLQGKHCSEGRQTPRLLVSFGQKKKKQ